MFDIVCDYANLGRGLVGPLARRSRDAAAAGAATSSRLAIATSLRVVALVSRPLRDANR